MKWCDTLPNTDVSKTFVFNLLSNFDQLKKVYQNSARDVNAII